MLFSACSKAASPEEKRDQADKLAVPNAPERGNTGDAGDIAVAKPAPVTPARPARQGLARRCVLGGDPLVTSAAKGQGCPSGGEGIGFGKDGLLYVVDQRKVRRYQRTAGDACTFEPSGAPIELPPDNPRPQKLEGRVFFRSGGAKWKLVRGGDAMYAHDFLGGLFRIDSGKPEPACDDVFGFHTVAAVGKKLVIARSGIEELRLGKNCKAVRTKLDDKASGSLYGVRGKLYLANGSKLVRYDGSEQVKLAEGTRLCYASGLAPCGNGSCVLDSNCMQLIQLGADDKVLRTIDDDKLFATRPYQVVELTSSDAGDVYVLARHRDTTSDKEICEAAVYEVPAAAFAL